MQSKSIRNNISGCIPGLNVKVSYLDDPPDSGSNSFSSKSCFKEWKVSEQGQEGSNIVLIFTEYC